MNASLVPILGIIGALAVASGIAYVGSSGGVTAGGWPVFLICGVFAFVVQWLMFIHAWAKKTEHFFDLTGSITYVVMIVGALLMSGRFDLGSLVVCGCILIWAGRLGPFLFQRVKNAGEDRRFRAMKENFMLFLMTWTLQGTWVFVTAACALAALTSSQTIPLGGWMVAGLVLWIAGFAIEVIADRQKTEFRADPANQDKFITHGLWAWSRHPNYFGEIMLWCGIAVISYPALVGLQIFTLISPIFVVVLLTAISGVRMLETRGNRKWGDDPEYQAYKRATPVLVMWPPKKSATSV